MAPGVVAKTLADISLSLSLSLSLSVARPTASFLDSSWTFATFVRVYLLCSINCNSATCIFWINKNQVLVRRDTRATPNACWTNGCKASVPRGLTSSRTCRAEKKERTKRGIDQETRHVSPRCTKRIALLLPCERPPGEREPWVIQATFNAASYRGLACSTDSLLDAMCILRSTTFPIFFF